MIGKEGDGEKVGTSEADFSEEVTGKDVFVLKASIFWVKWGGDSTAISFFVSLAIISMKPSKSEGGVEEGVGAE